MAHILQKQIYEAVLNFGKAGLKLCVTGWVPYLMQSIAGIMGSSDHVCKTSTVLSIFTLGLDLTWEKSKSSQSQAQRFSHQVGLEIPRLDFTWKNPSLVKPRLGFSEPSSFTLGFRLKLKTIAHEFWKGRNNYFYYRDHSTFTCKW